MTLSQIDINIIINEINQDSKDQELINYVKGFVNKDFLELLTSDRYIINKMPKTVLKFYNEYIELNFREILTYCSIEDITLLSNLINLCKANEDDVYNLSRKVMEFTTLDPEFLYNRFPTFFSERVVLNYSPKVLNEKFICKLFNFPAEINTGFFILNPVTKTLMKKILRYSKKESIESFFRALEMCLDRGTAKIEPDALKYCIHPLTLPHLLVKYQLDKKEQITVFNISKYNNDILIDFLKTQNVIPKILKKLVKRDAIKYYLAFNPYCTDDLLIELNKTNKNIDWLFIHTNINLSEHIEYAKYLSESGNSLILESNLLLSEQNGQRIKNIRALQKLNVDNNLIQDIFAKKASEMEIGIHNELDI